ncbi:MAG: hypothetical protein V3U06_03105 [Candidatus Binatia bacterium]
MKRVERFMLLTFLVLLFAVVRPTAQGLPHEGHDHEVGKFPRLQLAQASANPGKAVILQLAFECAKFQGDCGKVKVIKPPRAQERLWLQGTGVSPEKALRGDVVKDGVFRLEPGTFVYAKIAYVNDTNAEIRFRAIPHFVDPGELQGLALLNCMCLGETFRVPPGRGWFRVIRVGAARDVPPGSRFKATHILTSDGLE